MNVYITGEDGNTREVDGLLCPVLVIDSPDDSSARRCGAEVSLNTSGLNGIIGPFLDLECENGHSLATGRTEVLRDMGRDEDGVPLGA